MGNARSFSLPLVMKRGDVGAAGEFSGLAASFTLDRYGDRIVPGAFARSLTALADGRATIPVLWQHDTEQPIGSIATAAETSAGLLVTGRLALGDPTADRALLLLKAGALSMSVGFLLASGGARIEDGVRLITAGDLVEVSLVAVPANPEAVVREAKAAIYESPAGFARTLRESLGLTRREAEIVAKSAWPNLPRASGAESDDDPETVADAEHLRGELASLLNAFKE